MGHVIALVSHDGKKSDMITFARDSYQVLSRTALIGTEGTATRLRRELGLSVMTCGHGPSGGDVTIAAAVAAGDVAAVIFFLDPASAHPHQTDFGALIRQCCVHDVPVALNPSTAKAIMAILTHPVDPAIPAPRTAPGAARATAQPASLGMEEHQRG